MTDHQNCRTWNCRTWKWRTKLQGMKLQNMKMTDMKLQDKIIKNAVFAVLHFRVPQFCALLYGPSVSGPAIFGRVFRGLSDLPSRVLCVVACNSIMTIVWYCCCYYFYYYCCVLHADATPVSDYLCTSGSDEPDIHTRTCSVPRVLPRVLPGTVCTTWSHSHLFGTVCSAVRRFQLVSVVRLPAWPMPLRAIQTQGRSVE